jgi:hypothetical protein
MRAAPIPPGLLQAAMRLRTPLSLAAAAILLVSSITGPRWLNWMAIALFAAVLVLLFLPGAIPADSRRDPVRVLAPVRGRWVAINSPASRTPSHGTHAYGQTYAIDLIHHPDEGRPWSGVVSWPLARRPQAFPGFGQPVFAPADGVVVRVSDWQRDHWSRNSWPAVAYMLVEGSLREATGPGRVLGNHIVLDLGDGVYALLAHLCRRSAVVATGDRVRAGQQLAACGNSGNSSEPHVHFQLMDRSRALLGSGLPFEFSAGVPKTGQAFTPEAPEAVRAPD